jgi:hypothetical protein
MQAYNNQINNVFSYVVKVIMWCWIILAATFASELVLQRNIIWNLLNTLNSAAQYSPILAREYTRLLPPGTAIYQIVIEGWADVGRLKVGRLTARGLDIGRSLRLPHSVHDSAILHKKNGINREQLCTHARFHFYQG